MTRSAESAILRGGLIAGVLDIFDAFIFNGLRGVGPVRILHYIASGLLGPSAFRGRWKSAALGLLLHFFIALTVACVYYAASRALKILRQRPVMCGLLYGGAVYIFMNYVVLPLSSVPKNPRPPSWPVLINGVLAIMLCVGLPVALATKRWGRN